MSGAQADRLEGILFGALRQLERPGALEGATVGQLARIVSVMVDKWLLLRGQATVITKPEKLDLSRLSDDDLRLFESLLTKAKGDDGS